MVLIPILFSLWFGCFAASAGVLDESFKAKDYKTVALHYRNNPAAEYTRKELVMISYSLRKMGFFRQDIKLNIRLVKKHYAPEHKKLIAAIKRGDTIDGEEYTNSLKVLYWNLFTSYGEIIKGYDQDSPKVEKDHKHFLIYSKLLSELEFREGKVDKYNDLIIAQRQLLKNKIYKLKFSASLQYVSWQQDATLRHSTAGETSLITTNKGYCAGGDVGYENHKYHFYVDGCFLIGSGGVKNTGQTVITNYQQENIPAMGIKTGPGASLIVSSSRSRVGIRLPIIYSIQKLTVPSDPSYTIDQSPALSFVASAYSRWQFDKWYFQTEFGKYLQQEQTFWGLGLGREF